MRITRKNIPLLLLLNGAVAAAIVSCFTVLYPYTLGSDYGICRILSWIITAVLICFAGIMDYSLLFSRETPITKVDSPEKCIQVLEQYAEKAGPRKMLPWKQQIEKAIQIVEHFQKNEETLTKLSYAKFGDETEAREYQSVIHDLEESIVDAMQHILTRLCIMDESQFRQAMAAHDEDTIRQYQGHERYIDSQLAFANKLVHSFADLITEVSLIGDVNNEGTMNNLEDIITAIRRLNSNKDEVDELADKYSLM